MAQQTDQGFGLLGATGVPDMEQAAPANADPFLSRVRGNAEAMLGTQRAQANTALLPMQQAVAGNNLQNSIDLNPLVQNRALNEAKVADGLSQVDLNHLPNTSQAYGLSLDAGNDAKATTALGVKNTALNSAIGQAWWTAGRVGDNTGMMQMLNSNPLIQARLGGPITSFQRVTYQDPTNPKVTKMGAQITVQGQDQPRTFTQEYLDGMPNPSAGQTKLEALPMGSLPVTVNSNTNQVTPVAGQVPYHQMNVRPMSLKPTDKYYVGADGQEHVNPGYDPSATAGKGPLPYASTGHGGVIDKRDGSTRPDPNFKPSGGSDATATRERLIGQAASEVMTGTSGDYAKGGDPDYRQFVANNVRAYIDRNYQGGTPLSQAISTATQQMRKDYMANKDRAARGGAPAAAGAGAGAGAAPGNTDSFFNQFGLKQ